MAVSLSMLLVSGGAAVAAAPANTWPEIGHDPQLTGYSPDPLISTANAGSFGVKWMQPTGADNYSSPVTTYNSTLNESLVIQGNEGGYLTAFDAATGKVVWSTLVGSAIRDTPVVDGNDVWVADTYSPAMDKVNATTGAVECSVPMISVQNGSPVIGAGPGGKPTVYIAVLDLGTISGPIYAIDEASCAVDWKFTNFLTPNGSWTPISYATTATGEHVILAGTADPDSSMYAIDAATGQRVWAYVTAPGNPNNEDDVGAGATVTAPGVNGFADGVAYFTGETGYVFAVDLTTGALIWKFNGLGLALPHPFGRSTGSIIGNEYITGTTAGVLALNATTGAQDWLWLSGATKTTSYEVVSAIATVGPSGQQVVAVNDMSGTFDLLNAATGVALYRFHMGGFALTSVSDLDGNLYASSSNGYLYDFTPGGSNSGYPTTAITSPANGSSVANPGGHLTITGTAASGPIANVAVAIQSGGTSGPWWNSSTGSWTTGYFDNQATLASPGAAATNWSISIPVPPGGGTYAVAASAEGNNGLADTAAGSPAPAPEKSSFGVKFSKTAPHLAGPQGIYATPGGSLLVSGGGFGANEQVALTLAGASLGKVTANASGSFGPSGVTIPANATFGQGTLVATGQTSGKTSNLGIQVSNEWRGFGYDSLHGAFEPNDLQFSNHVSAVLQDFLANAWTYPDGYNPTTGKMGPGGPISSTPAYNKGTLYFGDDAGTFTALNVHTGAPVWTYSAGAAIDSSPAIVGPNVVFGTGADKVVALNSATGAAAWSATTTSAVASAPANAQGVVLVGTDDGTVYDLNAQTGKVLWMVKLGGAVKGSPAIDATAGNVIVGDASGAITALNLTTGAQLWQMSTSGPITASPTVYNGQVLIGSGNGVEYSLKESTGATQWQVNTGAAVTASAALYANAVNGSGTGALNQIVVGNSAGRVLYLSLSNGTANRDYTETSGIVGISDATGWAVINTAGGQVIGYKFATQKSWVYQASAGFTTSPVVVNGVVYLAGQDQTVSAWTIPGQQIP
jgi:outer membrane protein assembly factor BamB